MDGQAPPLDALAAPEPPAVAGEPQPSQSLSPASEAEGGLQSGTVDQAPPLDGSAADDPATLDGELPAAPQPLEAEGGLQSGTVDQDRAQPLDGFAAADPATFDELPVAPQPLEAEGAQPDAGSDASSGAPEAGGDGVVLTDELRDQIVKQVEYYFSDENLPNDKFMLKYVKKNKEGFVPIGVIASFRRMKKLVQDISTIEAALRTSSKLVVNSDGRMVRRLHPLPHNELKDPKKSTVVVDNLPSGFSVESIHEMFGTVGKIVNVTINGPPSGKDSTTTNYISSSKIHALVEYETVEAAEKAVTTLSDETNWRTGMKVRLLAKQSVKGSGKHNQFSKENQDTVSVKNNQNLPSKEEQHATSEKNTGADSVEGAKENLNSVLTPEDEHQQQKPNAKGGRKGRYKGQGKGQGQGQGQVQQYTNKQGNSGSESLNKPIPGPRMPDGTKGFTMGRGRSLPLQKSEKAEE